MLDNATVLIATYAAMTAGITIAVAKLSPAIGPRLRDLFSGSAPLAGVLALRMDGADSVTLYGTDLIAASGLLVLGLATSTLVTKFLSAYPAENRPVPR